MTVLTFTDNAGMLHTTIYVYSGDGVMAVEKTYENGVLERETRFVRDGLFDVQERDGNNAVVREYTWGLNLGGGIGGLLNLTQGGQNYSYLYDGNGNVIAVLDAAQALAAAYRHDPFGGNLVAKTGSLTQPFMFSTKRYDEHTGLYDYGFRWYAPAIGRWTTRDPLGEAGGLNLYAFVGNNPVNWMDPWGLTAADIAVTFLDDVVGVSLPSIGTSALVNGVTAGLGALLGNMIFPSPVGVGSDVIPLPTLPMSPPTIAPTSFPVPLTPVCEIRRGPRPWEERHPKTTPPFIAMLNQS